MPIYMIMPRYSHNYSLFYQLLNSSLFTHRNTYAILREATSETYGPRVYFPSYKFPIYIIRIPKLFILLSLSDLTFASGREGIDNPFIVLVASSFFVCVGAWDLWGASYWIDTLVLKNWGKYLRYYCCITLSSSRKTNTSSRRSKKDFWRHCRGGLRSSQDIPSTHHKPISLAFTLFAICLSFSSPPLHTTREKPIHRILAATRLKKERCCQLVVARVRETRCWYVLSSSHLTKSYIYLAT